MRTMPNQRGDTIVEVLIAIAVASSVLGSAYAIVNRTVKSQQQSSEHTEALKIAESQIELLRNADISTVGTCLSDPPPISPPCKFGTDERYGVAITRDPLPDNNLFRIKVSWPGINGGTDEVSLSYRIY